MSVFLPNLDDNSISVIRRVRKKYNTKYNAKYKEEYPWALPSSKGELYAFCQLCSVDISIKSVGAKGLRDHEATCRHSQKAHENGYRSNIPSSTVTSLPPTQGCFEHPSINMSMSSHQPMATTFTSSTELSPTFTTSRIFPNVSVEKDSQNHLVPIMDQNPVLTSSQGTSTLASTSYPVLEAVEGEMKPSCRNPPTPQTPNTPSSPLTQDNYVQKLNHSSTNTLHTLTNAIPEEFHPQSHPQNHPQSHPHPQAVSQDPLLVENRRVSSSLMCYSFQPNMVDTNYANVPPCTNEINNQKYVKRSESPSVEDLTCNFCNKVFSDWKDLKKDLMEHIKNANTVKGDSVNSKVREKESKGKIKRTVKQKKIQSLDSKTVEVTKRKRGRPPGKKKFIKQPDRKVLTSPENSSFTDSTNTNSTFSSCKSNSIQTVKKLKKKRGRPVKKNDEGRRQTESHSKPSVVSESSVESTFCYVGIVKENSQAQGDGVKNKPRVTKTASKKRPGQLQCRVCRVVFQTKQDLKVHYEVEHNNGRPYWCQTCDKSFTTKNNLEVHEKHKHIQGPNPCMCTVCGKVLSSRTNLKIHLMIHKGEKPFCCPICSKSFSRKANMEMHMVYHTGERRYTCEACGQSFFAISALRRHIKLHSGFREFACEVCGATYVTGTDLKRHLLKHQAVKPFPCTICDKQFTRSHDLKVHMRYHNKEIRFTCDICGKQFVESGNYRRHMRRHTGERPYTCTVCQQTFTQVHHYKVHVRTNHPDQADDVEWNSNSSRSFNKNNSFNQRASLQKRSQKNEPIMNSSNKVPDPIISHQVCPPPATSAVPVNPIPEHVIHSFHVQSANNNNSNNNSSSTLHNNQTATTITNLVPISNSVVNMSDIHHSHSSTVTPSVVHVPMMSTHHTQVPQTVSHPPTGFIQYNSYIYNTGVISPYQPLFDMCPQ